MRRKYERSYRAIRRYFPQILISSMFFIGIIFGSLFSNSLDTSTMESGAEEVSILLEEFIRDIKFKEITSPYLLTSSFYNYFKQIFLVWFFAFIPLGIPLIGLLIGAQGFSYGFTSSSFIMKYGFKGLLVSISAYGIQGAIYIYIIYSLSILAIMFSSKDVLVKPRTYLMSLLFSAIGVVFIVLYETYLMPIITQIIISKFF